MFGQAEWTFSDTMALTVGGRWTDDDKDGSGYRSTSLEFTFGGSKSFWPVEDRLIWT